MVRENNWNSKANPWTNKELGFFWISEGREQIWISMANPWIPMDINAKDINGYPCTCMDIH